MNSDEYNSDMTSREPNLPAETVAAHLKACAAKLKTYEDPFTQMTVHTEYYLLDRGFCCNQGCRHCPYWDKPQIKISFR